MFVSKHSSSATLVRGILDLELAKPTRVTAIEVSIVATWTTDWPAGIPPTYQDHSEMAGEAIVMDLLYSDKLMMALKSSSSAAASTSTSASGSGANAGSTSASPTGSGTSTPSGSHKHHHSRFTSVSNLLKSSLAASSTGAQQGVELPAGSYTCPFSFTLPKDAVPSISLPHGSRTYHLKAHIHRAGMLTPSVTRIVPFTVVLLNDSEFSYVNVSHEDRWKDNLLYAWRLGSQPAFVLGESIPLELTFVPLDKVFIHKIVVTLHQKEMYRARKGTVEERAQRSFELLSLKHPAGRHHHDTPPLLPILPNSPPNALSLLTSASRSSSSSPSSPTYSTAQAGPSTSNHHPDLEYAAQLQSLEGPWNLSFDMPIPPSKNHGGHGLHFTYDREPDSVIEIEHKLAIELHVSEALLSGNNAGKLREGTKSAGLEAGDIERITITVPVHILDSHAGSATTSLPSYFEVQDPHPDDPYHFLLRNGLNPTASSSSSSLPATIKSIAAAQNSKKASVSLSGSGNGTSTGTSTPTTMTAPSEYEIEGNANTSTILPPLRPLRREPHPLSLSQLSYDLENTTLSDSPPPSAAPSLSPPTEREPNTARGLLGEKYPDADSKTLEQLRRFTQLIGGRVSVDGALPPVYQHQSSSK